MKVSDKPEGWFGLGFGEGDAGDDGYQYVSEMDFTCALYFCEYSWHLIESGCEIVKNYD